MDSDFRTWCLLCFQCKVVKPFNGIGVFYGRFVKDFSTHMSLVDSFVINGIKLHRSHVCGIVLRLLGQLSEIPCYKLGLLVETLSCKLDVNYDEPTIYVELEFVNLWKGVTYLSKNDVFMIENDCLLHKRENKIFVLRPLLITFHFAPYEDPFLCMPSLVKDAKSFGKMLKSMGVGSVRVLETKIVQLCDACVMWHNTCFPCMTIKPFNGVGIFYCHFVKDYASHGFVWDFNVKDCLGICFHIACVLVLSLLERVHHRGMVTSIRVVSGLSLYHPTRIFDLLSFYFIGVWNPDLRANPSQGREDDMTTGARHQESSLRREPWIDWGQRMKEKTCQGSNKARGPPEGARNREGPDLRTNLFQEGEDDTTMEAVHQSSYLQLALISILLVEMTSKSFETTTIVFGFKRASREYLTRPNRSPEEGVMAVLQKSRSAEKVPPDRVDLGRQIPPGRVATRRHSEVRNFHPGGWLSATKFHPAGCDNEGVRNPGAFTRLSPGRVT